jgi:hypothetical protein
MLFRLLARPKRLGLRKVRSSVRRPIHTGGFFMAAMRLAQLALGVLSSHSGESAYLSCVSGQRGKPCRLSRS